MRKRLALGLVFLALALSFAFLYKRHHLAFGDPDRYYHYALSRAMVESGSLFLRSVPQVEDLGWGDLFVDKEFFFHQLTALGWRFGGEAGVETVVVLCTLFSLLAFLLFAGRHLPPATAAAVTLFTFTSPLFLTRLLLLRPHVLAVLAFLLVCLAALSQRPKLTALAVFFFTLSYHAFYIPLVFLGFLVPLSFLAPRQDALVWRKVVALGAFGCLCGILVNPHFPGNLELAIIHARIPGMMMGELAGLNFGEEHTPLRSDAFLLSMHLPLLLLLAGVFVAGRDLKERSVEARRRQFRLLWLLGFCGLFLYLSFHSRRAVEYLVPAAGLLAVYLMQAMSRWPRATLAVAIGLCALELEASRFFFSLQDERVNTGRYRTAKLALAELPPESKGSKVYNCEWDHSPFLYYHRPDLRFVDILDPSLLYFAAKGPYRAREDFRRGYLSDVHGMIRDAAKADYVLCKDPYMTLQLREDPGFQQLYPKADQAGVSPALFRVRKENPPQYVRTYQVSQLRTWADGTLPEPRPGKDTQSVSLERSTYLNLSSLLHGKADNGTDGLLCGSVRVAAEEITRAAGAEALALGGGQSMQVFRNGKPLYRSPSPVSAVRSVQVTVPLSPQLSTRDTLDLVVCSRMSARFWGVTVSLWKRKELDDTCVWKGAVPAAAPGVSWAFSGLQRANCLGPVAISGN